VSSAPEQPVAARFALRARDDAGLTLIELLMSVAIMGVAFSVIVTGMFTFVTSANSHRTQANAGLYARQYAEAIANASYASCAASYGALPYTPPAGYVAANTVLIWDEYSSTFSVAPGSCSGADDRMQRVHITLVTTTGYTVTDDVVKRSP
jgi:prepilin-type N-terminal cleavage/methylation domain-containing protein